MVPSILTRVCYCSPVLLTTDKKGYAVSPDLDLGLYYLVETKSPKGYNLSADPIPVFATKTGDMTEYAVNVPNSRGVFLPETGGPGTILMTALGSLLCAIAAAILLTGRKKA